MKTYIIQIETHDDLTSVRDKLSWSKAQRVLFVWPRRGRVFNQFYELSLLKREAERLGIRLAFVTHDPAVKESANNLGIAVFPSVPVAEKQAWPGQMRKKIERNLPIGYDQLSQAREEFHPVVKPNFIHTAGRYLAFTLGILAVLGLLGFFLPSAQVKIFPERTRQEFAFKVWADDQLDTFTINGGVPAEVRKFELTLEQSGTSTGSVEASVEAAQGWVNFQSTFNQKISLPAGTLLQTEEDPRLFFILDQEIALDPATGGTVKAEVHAQATGEEGNLTTGTHLTVLSAFGNLISAQAAEAFTGGSSVTSPAPTDEDYAELEEKLLKALRTQAVDEMTARLSGDEQLVETTLSKGTVVNRVRSVEPGTPADHFALKLTVQFSALVYRQSDLQSLVAAVLDANLPEGMAAVDSSLELEPENDSMRFDSQGNPTWQINAQRWIIPKLELDTVSNRIAGIKTGAASQIIQTMVSTRQPSEIQCTPAWWKWMPFVPFRMQIEVY